MIYLDNSATTFYKPQEVKRAVNEAINLYTANAGRGAYKAARQSAEKIYEVREKVLEFFGANNHSCIFTSGCSSALNLAILGSVKEGGHVITTYLEHNSVLRPLEYLKREGKITYTVLENLDEDSFEKAIRPNTYLIATTQVSNVTGTHIGVEMVNKLCKKYNLLHLVDTAQGSGHVFDDLSAVDMIAFAGHKGLCAIGGVGGLIVKNDLKLKPIMFGGTGTMSENLIQPDTFPEGFEVGTLANIPIISLGAGIDYINQNKHKIIEKEKILNRAMQDMLNSLDFITAYYDKNSLGVFSFNVLDYDSSFVSDYLSEKFDICTRSGLHCAPLVHKHFGTLEQGAVRVSISHQNTFSDIKKLEFALKQLYSLK